MCLNLSAQSLIHGVGYRNIIQKTKINLRKLFLKSNLMKLKMTPPQKKKNKKTRPQKNPFVRYFMLLLNQNRSPKFGIQQLCFGYFSKGILASPCLSFWQSGGFLIITRLFLSNFSKFSLPYFPVVRISENCFPVNTFRCQVAQQHSSPASSPATCIWKPKICLWISLVFSISTQSLDINTYFYLTLDLCLGRVNNEIMKEY